MPNLKFKSDEVSGLLNNQGDQIGMTVRSWTDMTPVILCQGYGVGNSVPLRTLAYAVPVLRLARQLPRQTRVEFYWASEGVLRANSERSRGDVKGNVRKAMELLASYVSGFHPAIVGQVHYLEDKVLDAKAERAVAHLLSSACAIADEIPAIHSFCEKRGGVSALQYMTEHALYMRDPLVFEANPLPVIVDGMESPADKLIMVGGPAEQIFWKLRHALQQTVETHALWESRQFFTRVGDPPTYHPQPDEPFGDITAHRSGRAITNLDTLLSDARNIGRGVLWDWIVLLHDAAGSNRFPTSTNAISDPVTRNVLAEGFSRLIAWFGDRP